MGWKSSLDITRDQAIQRIMDRLDEASDEDLAMALEDIMGDNHGYNYRIVKDISTSDRPWMGEE